MNSSPLRPEHRRRFLSLVKKLNRLMEEVSEDIPEAVFYLAGDQLYLLSDDSGLRPLYDRELESSKLFRSSGGDW